jgi:hypothetical protein
MLLRRPSSDYCKRATLPMSRTPLIRDTSVIVSEVAGTGLFGHAQSLPCHHRKQRQRLSVPVPLSRLPSTLTAENSAWVLATGVVSGTAMPDAAVHEHGHPNGREDDVGGSSYVGHQMAQPGLLLWMFAQFGHVPTFSALVLSTRRDLASSVAIIGPPLCEQSDPVTRTRSGCLISVDPTLGGKVGPSSLTPSRLVRRHCEDEGQ